ncbi:hypothetical protein HD806DRAFT_511181 [Xylariaceae sp. AK1471]|nr:hypothetical protein HD806DRAFT_511181 [Xylariaceae sp. AK1471]
MATDDTESADPSWSSTGKLQDLHESHTKIIGLHHDATARLNKLERRVNKLESDIDSDSDASDEASDLDDDYMLGFEENIIHEVRDVNFEHFKNRYTEKDGKYCIEVLVAGSDLEEQVRRELKKRDLLDSDDMAIVDNYDESDEQLIHRVRIQSPSILFLLHSVLEHKQGNGSFLWRGQNRTTFFRPFTWFIYAQEKMKIKLEELERKFSDGALSLSTNNTQTVAELVFSLERAAILGKNAAGDGGAQASEPTYSVGETNPAENGFKPLPKRVERQALEQALLESYQTLVALRCYVSFVDERIMPQAAQYRSLGSPEPPPLVRYRDLAYLFQVGDLIYVNRPVIPTNTQQIAGPRIGRVRSITKPDATANFTWDQQDYVSCTPRRRRGRETVNHYSIQYHVVDYNGESYITLSCSFSIGFFKGQVEITSLTVFPLQFHPDREKLIRTAQASGKNFRDAVTSKHMLYCGWSVPSFPPQPQPQQPIHPPGMFPRHQIPLQTPRNTMLSEPPRPVESQFQNSYEYFDPETESDNTRGAAIHKVNYIESEVIVDVKEAIRAVQHWRLTFGNWIWSTWKLEDWSVVQDSIEIIRWTDRHRKQKLSSVQDRTQANDNIAGLESDDFHRQDNFARPQPNPDFTPEDLTLLPKRLYAYALRERKFFSGDVESFHRLATGDNPFENLKIDENHIRIVQSVVWSHFQRKLMESSGFQSQMDQDLIRGKGRGLVILLHGAPGVGKTATAEAVALWHRKPLFVITCGDLGFTPQGVESSLSEIFRLAHLWNCILLLDEADVFLSQRETNALQRNALVSVFLRVLEYYNGILFLTTNRVGTLDEAFKSRVHLSLYYPALGRSQTEEIMLMNLNRLDIIEQQRAKSTSQKPLIIRKDRIRTFARNHWDRHAVMDGEGRWNGRQIRNAVQIAASLALYDRKTDQDQGTEDIPAVLDDRQFEIVEQTMTLFEGYMNKTRGGSAAFIAQQRSERDDRFKTPQPGLTRDQQYEIYSTSNRELGDYTPYPNRPQYSGLSQPYPMTQQYPQHFTQSDPVHGPPGTSAPFVTAESAGHVHAQAELYRSATHQQMPSGVSPLQPGLGHSGQASSYTATGLPPPGMSFQPRDQFTGSSTGRQGYEPSN